VFLRNNGAYLSDHKQSRPIIFLSSRNPDLSDAWRLVLKHTSKYVTRNVQTSLLSRLKSAVSLRYNAF